ncbi:MAG: ATP-dependent helicase [Thermosediminibacterales bacterium]|nr:ATP-dependent helicase [Thermosediminibacterales bacterium]
MVKSYNDIIINLANILDKKSGDVAEVIKLLEKCEVDGLKQLLDETFVPRISSDNYKDISLKLDAISSLIYILHHNPKLNNTTAKIKGEKGKDVLKTLYNVAFELSINKFILKKEMPNIERLFILTLVSFYGLLADKQTISDIFIKKYIDDLIKSVSHEENLIKRLEAFIYIALITLTIKIDSKSALDNLDRVINDVEYMLGLVQQSEIDKESIDMEKAFLIAGLANIIYITKIVKTYLFTGKVESDERANIYSYIDKYCYNANKLLKETKEENIKKTANLLKYTLEQICRNSIWSFADRSPVIKKFFIKSLESEEDFIYTLLPSQRDSILDILTAKRSIVINMPTSSGKSLLAELYILFTMHNYKTEDFEPTVCYVVPTNALINQVNRKLKEDFAGFNFTIETVLPFYDIDEIEANILNLKHIHILITTPEKLDLLIRQEHPALNNLKLIILDEAHNIADKERGSKFELLLALIKQKRRDVNFFLMSPFIKNADKIAEWLGDTQQDSKMISLQWSPTKQYIGCNLLKNNKNKSVVVYYPSPSNNIIKEKVEVLVNPNIKKLKDYLGEESVNKYVKNIALIEKYIKIGSVLILCEGPGTCEKMAKKCYEYLKDTDLLCDNSENEEIKKAIELIRLETTEDNPLVDYITRGITYHHARMSSLVKEEIENLINNGLIKIICATTTLAQGMNFPITTVIFSTVAFRNEHDEESNLLTNAQFWNIAGRAGRAYKDKEGHIITPFINVSQKKTGEIIERYIKGGIEEISSTLADFFDKIGDYVDFNHSLIEKNAAASNFLQYLNHIVNVAYDYNINNIDISAIRSILDTSLFYKEQEYEQGFIEVQDKINRFARRYIEHLQKHDKSSLKTADKFGISDISYRTFKKVLNDFIKSVYLEHGKEKADEFIKVSNIILKSQNYYRLADVIKIISKIPEIKLGMFEHGSLNSENIAKVIIGWVNGKKVSEIAKEIKYDGDFDEILGKCYQYINGRLKSFVPWGISLYQYLTHDTDGKHSQNLPSYIYYGVNNVESVILSKVGVPRFAINQVKEKLKKQYPDTEISIKNIEKIKHHIKNLIYENKDFEGKDIKLIKEIIDSGIY